LGNHDEVKETQGKTKPVGGLRLWNLEGRGYLGQQEKVCGGGKRGRSSWTLVWGLGPILEKNTWGCVKN